MTLTPTRTPTLTPTLTRCVTYSVGFRAPSRAELLRGLAAHVARRLPADDLYADAGLSLQEPGLIDAAAVGRVREMLRETLEAVLSDEDEP